MPLAVETWSLSHWTARGVPSKNIFITYISQERRGMPRHAGPPGEAPHQRWPRRRKEAGRVMQFKPSYTPHYCIYFSDLLCGTDLMSLELLETLGLWMLRKCHSTVQK